MKTDVKKKMTLDAYATGTPKSHQRAGADIFSLPQSDDGSFIGKDLRENSLLAFMPSCSGSNCGRDWNARKRSRRTDKSNFLPAHTSII
jgi:hypothetical protein